MNTAARLETKIMDQEANCIEVSDAMVRAARELTWVKAYQQEFVCGLEDEDNVMRNLISEIWRAMNLARAGGNGSSK